MPGSAIAIEPQIHDVSAEFLNSLASVHSLSEILRDHPGIDNQRKRHFIDIILTETQRMVEMVEEFPQLPISA